MQRKAMLIFGLVFLFLAAGFVAVSFDSSVSAQANEVKAVTDVLTREAQAVEKGNLAALDKIWANDESVTVFESGHANYGWTDYRNSHLAPELKEFKNTKYAFSDLKVKVDGKTAWATFKYSLAADMGRGTSRAEDSGRQFWKNETDAGKSFIGIRAHRVVRLQPNQVLSKTLKV